MPAFLAPLAIAGVSSLANYLGNRKNSRTSTSTSTQKFNNSSSGSTSRTLLPQQMDAVDAIGGRIRSLYNPGQSLEPMRQGARSAVNQRYAGLSDAVAAKTMSHGGRSGQFGQGVLRGELARLGDLGRVDTDYAQLALDQQRQGDALAMGLMGQSFGSSFSSTDSGERTATGEGVDAGDPLAAALGGGASSAANLYRLLMLDGLMRNNGGGGGGLNV